MQVHALAPRDVEIRYVRNEGARAFMRDECLLDVMHQSGKLIHPEDENDRVSARRYEAGLWLRRLYGRCNLSTGSVTMNYQVGTTGQANQSDEAADRLRWNQNALRDTHRAVGRYWTPLRNVCVFDLPITEQGLPRLLAGLDALADYRGM